MRAIVTGGAGFVGSHVADGLVRSGADVLVLDDLSSGSERNLGAALENGARLCRVDIREGPAVLAVVRGFAPDIVFHLAAQVDVRTSMADPARDAAVNIIGSVNILAAAAAVGVRRMVNTSTGGAIYGEAGIVPTPESEPPRPLSAYGLSKRTVEEYGAWFRAVHDLDVITLRYGNVYGPRQNPRGDAGVVAVFCDRLLSGDRPVVFGDGTQTRDYVFVGDIVAANLAAATAAGLAHDRYNIGTGTEASVLDLIGAIARAAGVDPGRFAPEFRPTRAGEVARSCLDVSLARSELGLGDPTPLLEGLSATLAWARCLARSR